MEIEKKRGRPKGSKNKLKERKIEVTIEKLPKIPIIKKRGRPQGSKNKPLQEILTQETNDGLDNTHSLQYRRIVWEHLSTGNKNYINLKNNLELHKEDIPIFAADYRQRFQQNPKYAVINVRNKHLIPYIQEEFPDIGIGHLGGIALWEMLFCFG